MSVPKKTGSSRRSSYVAPPIKQARGRHTGLLPPDRTSKRPCDRGPWSPPKSETTNDVKNAAAVYSAGSQPSHNTTRHAEHNNTKQPPLSSLLHFLQRPKTRSLAQKMCARSTLNRAYFGNTAKFYCFGKCSSMASSLIRASIRALAPRSVRASIRALALRSVRASTRGRLDLT